MVQIQLSKKEHQAVKEAVESCLTSTPTTGKITQRNNLLRTALRKLEAL